MKREEWVKYFERLPKPAKDYLISTISGDQEEVAREYLEYEYDAWERVMDVIWDLYFLKFNQETFRERLVPLIGERRIDDVESTLLLHLVLPIADIIPWSVEDRLTALGVSSEEVRTVKRVNILPISFSIAAKRVTAESQLTLFTNEIQNRIKDLLISINSGLRTKTQVLEFLIRKQNAGGIGLTEPQALQFFSALEIFLATNRLMSDADYEKWKRIPENIQKEYWDNTLAEEDTDEEVEDEGTDAQNDLVEGANRSKLSSQYDPILEQAIIECLDQIGDLKLDEYIQKRLENVISTRLRNVRNSIQTLGILGREQHIGGVGLDQQTTDRVSKIIEASYELHHTAIEEDQRKKVIETQQAQQLRVDERRKQESREHAEWYQQKVGGATVPGSVGTPLTSQPRMTMNISGISSPQGQLSDLIGELKTMDTETFRRLAKGTEDAGDRLFQKFETLRQESFERYTAGIEAWRSSPLQKRYLELVSESFTKGKTVAEIAEQKRQQDPNTPTTAELGAIMTVNAKIQY